MVEALMTTKEAAEYLQISEWTLGRWRRAGEGPKSHKLGRQVRYRRQDLEIWIRKQ